MFSDNLRNNKVHLIQTKHFRKGSLPISKNLPRMSKEDTWLSCAEGWHSSHKDTHTSTDTHTHTHIYRQSTRHWWARPWLNHSPVPTSLSKTLVSGVHIEGRNVLSHFVITDKDLIQNSNAAFPNKWSSAWMRYKFPRGPVEMNRYQNATTASRNKRNIWSEKESFSKNIVLGVRECRQKHFTIVTFSRFQMSLLYCSICSTG